MLRNVIVNARPTTAAAKPALVDLNMLTNF